mgnify:FL=1
MNQDTYTLRQLLVGFRNEYLKAKKELDELNQMLENYSNGKYDYQLSLFYPFFNSQLDAGLIIRIKQKRSTILQELEKSLRKLGIVPYKKNTMKMVCDEQGMYHPSSSVIESDQERSFVKVKDEAKEEFAHRADLLRKSEFARKMVFTEEFQDLKNHGVVVMQTTPNYEQSFVADSMLLSYSAFEDTLCLSAIKPIDKPKYRLVTNESLQKALDVQLPKNIFSDYHKMVIEENLSSPKEIVISEEYKPRSSTCFTIEENPKVLVLHPPK